MTLDLCCSPGPDFLKRVREVAYSVPDVVDVHDLISARTGPGSVYVGMHVVVRRGLSAEDSDRVSEEVAQRVQEETGSEHVIVHLDVAGDGVAGDGVAGDGVAGDGVAGDHPAA